MARELVRNMWRRDEGVLTFEWILLLSLVAIGIVGGISAVRDGLIDELGDVVGAVINVDQSYTVESEPCPPDPPAEPRGNAFGFTDEVPSCSFTGGDPESPARGRKECTEQPITDPCQ